eukprot:2377134-Pyramimonas_sp.AAC.1
MRTAPRGPSVELPLGPRNVVRSGGRRMRTAPLGPSVEFFLGPRGSVLDEGNACELHHWDLRWSSPWGHGAL